MKYFIDFEFLEGDIPQKICGFTIPRWLSKPHNTIQPISLGIISEDNREYYAISKDFNLEEAWNRFDWKQKKVSDGIPGAYKEYWIRENVLKPIWRELFFRADDCSGLSNKQTEQFFQDVNLGGYDHYFSFKSLKALIDKYGKTNKEIAEEIKDFCKLKVKKYGTLITSSNYPGGLAGTADENLILDKKTALEEVIKRDEEERNRRNPIFRASLLTKEFDVTPKFYAYYADYDWVAFCWLFGKMIDLPNGFPKYCNDLKQEMDRNSYKDNTGIYHGEGIKKHPNYTKQENEHNALADARWNKKLHEFLLKF